MYQYSRVVHDLWDWSLIDGRGATKWENCGSAGADTGFRKGEGGGGVRVTVKY